MKISILVPVYNVACKIERCAVSLFEQTYEDIEYIFVDDCSPDNSIEVLQEVAARYPEREKQVKILHHEKNRGLAAARNTALDAAMGELLMIVDSDDYIALNACETLLSTLLSKDVDVVTGAYIDLLPESRMTIVLPPRIESSLYLHKQIAMATVPTALWGRLYRRSLFTEHGLRWQEGVNLAEDYMMICRIMLHARRAETDAIVYCYDETELHDASKMYARHIEQLAKAVIAVDEYYSAAGSRKRFSTSFQLAYLNVCRSAYNANLSAAPVYTRLSLWARPLAWLISKRPTFAIANAIYKTIRHLNLVCRNS